jgi:hypothetical protein
VRTGELLPLLGGRLDHRGAAADRNLVVGEVDVLEGRSSGKTLEQGVDARDHRELRVLVISKTAAPGRLLDDAVAWAALVPPDGYPLTRSRSALQATTMAAIDAAARLDRDWLSRKMSDSASLRAHARRHRELKGREITWALPEEPL